MNQSMLSIKYVDGIRPSMKYVVTKVVPTIDIVIPILKKCHVEIVDDIIVNVIIDRPIPHIDASSFFFAI